MDISIKRTLKIAHCLCLFCAIQQRKKAAAISLPQLFGGSWWIRKPRSKKQSAGLFFAVCGRPTCSNPTSSSTKKDPQPKLRVLFVSTLQKGCPLNQPFSLYTHQLFLRHFSSFPSWTKPARMRLAVAAETSHKARTSAFIINGWSFR